MVSPNGETCLYSENIFVFLVISLYIGFQQMVKYEFQVKMEKNNILKAEEVLNKCLKEIPFLNILDLSKEFNQKNVKVDIWIKVQIPSGYQDLAVEVKNSGEPRIIRESINKLKEYLEFIPNSYGLIIAPFIFSKSAEMCKKAGIGYLDFAGNCFLCFQQVYVVKEGRPKKNLEERILKSLYYPKAERALRVLLNNPNKLWQTQELADQAKVSLGMSSKVKKRLDTLGWTKAETKGFKLVEWEELLKEWTSKYSFKKNAVYEFYSMESETDLERILNDYCKQNNIPFALTLFSGAARVAPYTRVNKVFAYVGKYIDNVQKETNLKPVSSGSNLTLLLPYDEGVYYGSKDFNNIKVVSPIQLYLDLNSYKGRGEEAAQFLYEQIIKPQWLQNQTILKEK